MGNTCAPTYPCAPEPRGKVEAVLAAMEAAPWSRILIVHVRLIDGRSGVLIRKGGWGDVLEPAEAAEVADRLNHELPYPGCCGEAALIVQALRSARSADAARFVPPPATPSLSTGEIGLAMLVIASVMSLLNIAAQGLTP